MYISNFEINRNHLYIFGSFLVSGGNVQRFDKNDPSELLRTYLVWIREMRNQRRQASLVLREKDLDVLADYLQLSKDSVRFELNNTMESTRFDSTFKLPLLVMAILALLTSTPIVVKNIFMDSSLELVRISETIVNSVSSPRTVSNAVDAPTVVMDTPTVSVLQSLPQVYVDAESTELEIENIDTTATELSPIDVVVFEEPVSSVAVEDVAPVATAVISDGSTVAVVAPPVPDVTN